MRVLVVLSVAALLAPSLPAQWYELSGDPGITHTDSSRGTLVQSHDGQFVIYRGDDGTAVGLYRVPADGSSDPVLLTPAIPATSVSNPQISVDDQWLVYHAEHGGGNRNDLYSIAIDGGGTPNRLSASQHNDARVDTSYVLSDSQHVVFSQDADVDAVFEIFVVPIDGSTAPVRVNQDLAVGQTVRSFFRLAEPVARAVYTVHEAGQPTSLHSAPLDGSQANLLLSGTMDVGLGWALSPDGATVAFSTDVGIDEEVYSAATDGSAGPTRFTLATRFEAFEVQFTPDSGTAVIGCESTTGNGRLFSAPADALTNPIRLSASIDVASYEWKLSPDGTQVAFLDDVATSNLRVAATDGSGSPIKITQYNSGLGVERFAFTPDSLDTVFTAYSPVTALLELLIVPADGSSNPTLLSNLRVDNRDPVISPAGDRICFLTSFGERELWSVPRDGSASAIRMNGTLPPSGSVEFLDFSAGGDRVYYFGDQHTKDVDEYYAAYPRPQTGIGLDVEPETPAPADPVAMTISGGVPGARVLWYLTGVDGAPLFLQLASTTLDGLGESSLSGDLPDDPGLSGVELAFACFSVNGQGQVVGSNRQEILVL